MPVERKNILQIDSFGQERPLKKTIQARLLPVKFFLHADSLFSVRLRSLEIQRPCFQPCNRAIRLQFMKRENLENRRDPVDVEYLSKWVDDVHASYFFRPHKQKV